MARRSIEIGTGLRSGKSLPQPPGGGSEHAVFGGVRMALRAISGKQWRRRSPPYYFVTKDGAHAFVPAHIANSDMRHFCRILAGRGILVPPGRQLRELQDMVSREQEFSPRNLVDRYGWHSDCFVLASGEVIAHAGQAPEVAVPLAPGKCVASGSLRQ